MQLGHRTHPLAAAIAEDVAEVCMVYLKEKVDVQVGQGHGRNHGGGVWAT